MEKRLTTIHGHTSCVAFDAETGRFFAKDVASDFAPQPTASSKQFTTSNASAPKPKRRTVNTFGRFDRDADNPQDHPRFV